MTRVEGSKRPHRLFLFSDDGFLRLSLDEMFDLRLEHLLSGFDPDPAEYRRCGSATNLYGYSEWVSRVVPSLSLGWDWRVVCVQGAASLVRVGLPRSNVLLIDGEGVDFGWMRNLEILGTLVDALPWRDDTPRALARCTL